MRKFSLFLHRWTGLALAGFLVVIALTGSIVAFMEELDRLLNPALITVPVRDAPQLDAVELRDRAAAMDPHATFEYFYLKLHPGKSFRIAPRPKPDPETGKPYVLGYNELFLDPYTGEKLGARDNSRALLPFIFNLHYGMAFGNRGVRFFGWLALVFTINCLLGVYLTFPMRWSRGWWRRWKPAWKIKFGGGLYRVSYDVHRAFGLWTLPLLLMLAWSGVLLNLPTVYIPVMKFVKLGPSGRAANVTPAAKALGTDAPVLDWRAAIETGEKLMAEQGAREGFTVRQGDFIILNRYLCAYEYDVRTSMAMPGMTFGDAGVFIDANTGASRGFWSERTMPAGGKVSNWLVMLHRGTVFGLPMRILLGVTGLVIAALSVTGVIIWWKKRAPAAKRPSPGQQATPSEAESS